MQECSSLKQKSQASVPHPKLKQMNTGPTQDQMIDLFSQQYYNYITLMKLTNNFNKSIELYRNLNLNTYQGNISIIGNCPEIDQSMQREGYLLPVIVTTIPESKFSQNSLSKAMIKRRLTIPEKIYMTELIDQFNKMLVMSKKQKNIFFAFTHLKIYLSEQHQLYFALTPESMIIKLEKQLYNGKLKIIQNAVDFTYGEVDLRTKGCLGNNGTYALKDVKESMQDTQRVMTGVVRKIDLGSIQEKNAKEKEISIEVMQEVWPEGYDQVGLCKIYVRYQQMEEDILMSFLRQGSIYLFVVGQVFVSDNVQLVFRIPNWKRGIMPLSTSHVLIDIEERYKKMKCSLINKLLVPGIWRNHYKFRLSKYEVKFMNFKAVCVNQKCKGQIILIQKDQYQCNGSCGSSGAVLKGWAIVICMDSSGQLELTVQDDNLLTFFNLEPQKYDILQQVAKEQTATRESSLTLINIMSNNNDQKEQIDNKIYQSNDYLFNLASKCLINVVECEVVGYARVSQNDTIYNQGMDLKQEMIGGFAKSKDMIKGKNIFLNGQIMSSNQGGRLVPQVKAQHVFASS